MKVTRSHGGAYRHYRLTINIQRVMLPALLTALLATAPDGPKLELKPEGSHVLL